MINTLWAILIAVVLIFLTLATGILLGAKYLFEILPLAGWTFSIATAVTLVIIGFFVRFWVLIKLPMVWQGLAQKNKFITLPKEKHWIPVEKADRFDRGYECLAGEVTIQRAHLKKSANESYLEKVKKENEYEVFGGLELWLHRYFAKQGYIWLGFDAGDNSTTKVGRLNIPKARLTVTPGLDDVTITTEPIDALRLTFIRYVRVDGIELLDGYKASILCMATITVTDAYLAWYGLGGKAYDALDTYITRLVRTNAEEVTLRSMYTPGVDNGQNIIEQAVKNGDPTMPKTIGMSATITIEGWDDNAPANFLELMGMVQKIEQETLIDLAKLDRERQVALGKVAVFDAEKTAEIERAKLEIQKALTNKKEWAAIRELAGKDLEVAANLVLQRQLGDKMYEKYLHSKALQNTKIQVLGGDALKLINPTPQPTTP